MFISLRIDHSLTEVVHWLDVKQYGGFAVREVSGDNEHWHFCIECNDIKVTAFRTALTRAVPALKGNASYSASEVRDLEKYERYMCKADGEGMAVEVVWCHSLKYNLERIEQLHVQYWNENRKIKKGRNAMSVVLMIAKQNKVSWQNRPAIAKLYIRELLVNGKMIYRSSVVAAVNAISLQLCENDDALDQFVMDI